MNRKTRVVLMMAIVGLLMAIGLSASFLAPKAEASHIKMFDMNDRGASKDNPYSGSGVSVVNGSNVDFMIQVEGLAPVDIYELGQRVTSGSGASIDRAAELAVFLASDASGQMTGRLISAVTDDFHNLPARIPEIMASDAFTIRRIELD